MGSGREETLLPVFCLLQVMSMFCKNLRTVPFPRSRAEGRGQENHADAGSRRHRPKQEALGPKKKKQTTQGSNRKADKIKNKRKIIPWPDAQLESGSMSHFIWGCTLEQKPDGFRRGLDSLRERAVGGWDVPYSRCQKGGGLASGLSSSCGCPGSTFTADDYVHTWSVHWVFSGSESKPVAV